MSISKNFRFSTALAIAASLSLAACGGGGGGGGGGGTPSAERTSAGVASKGILTNAQVKAYELSANGSKTRAEPIGEAVTGADGRYNLTIGSAYAGGPVLFELTVADATRMICDVPAGCGATAAFGDPVALDDNFKLMAIAPSIASGQSLSVQLTPLTTMAARRALNDQRGVTDTSVRDANSEASQIVGVNILTTEPADLTGSEAPSDENAATYAAFLAGIGSMAYGSEAGMTQFIEDLGASFEDGEFSPDDKVGIAALVEAVRETASAPELQDKLPAKVAQALDVIESGISDGRYNPEPSPVANESALAQGKALVQEARTLLTSVAALEEPLDALGVDAETAAAVLDQEVVALAELAAQVMDAVFTDGGDFGPGENRALELHNELGETIGTVEVDWTENAAGSTIAITSVTLPGDVDLALTVTTTLNASQLMGTEAFDVENAAISVAGYLETAGAKLTLDGIDVDAVLTEAITFDPVAGAPAQEPKLQTAGLSGELTIEAKASGAKFSGNASIEIVGYNAATSDNTLSIKRVVLGGGFSSPKGSFTARVALNIDNAATFDTFGYLDHEPIIDFYGNVPVDATALAMAAEAASITDASFLYSYSYDTSRSPSTEIWYDIGGASDVQGIDGDPLGAEAYVASLVESVVEEAGAAEGELRWVHIWHATEHDMANGGQQTWIGFTIDVGDFEDAQRFAKGSISATLDLALQGHPETSMTATVDRIGFDSGAAEVTFSHSGRQWSISAVKTAGEDVSAIEISNPDGVAMTIARSDAEGVEGEVKVGNEVVGHLQSTDNGLPLIRWADDSFESLQ